jgi:hypothetical protein
MHLDASRYRLFRELETLRLRWQQTQTTWQDVVRQEFTEEYWKALDVAVLNALAAMDRLGPILNQARQECAGREFI